MTKRRRPSESGPTAWREESRDESGARRPFPRKTAFIEHLRATNRPTAKDLRTLRAMKRTPPAPPAPEDAETVLQPPPCAPTS